MADQFDLTVIGSGPGAMSAIRAAQLGMRVAVVEWPTFGGTCPTSAASVRRCI